MNANKLAASALAIAVLNAVGVVYLATKLDAPASLPPVWSSPPVVADGHAETDVAALRASVEEMQRMLATLQAEFSAARERGGVASAAVGQMATTEDATDARGLSRTAGDAKIGVADRERASRERAERRVAAAENQLTAEDIDNSWAANYETSVRSELQSSALANVGLTALECRTSLCRLELAASDRDSDEVLSELLALPTFQDTQVQVNPDIGADGQTSYVIYVARQGQSLPRIER